MNIVIRIATPMAYFDFWFRGFGKSIMFGWQKGKYKPSLIVSRVGELSI